MRQVQLTARADRRERGERGRENVLSAPPDTRRHDTIVVARLDGGRGVYINRWHVDRPSGLFHWCYAIACTPLRAGTRVRGLVFSDLCRVSALPTMMMMTMIKRNELRLKLSVDIHMYESSERKTFGKFLRQYIIIIYF